MAAEKALKLAFILSATDKMSRVIDQAVNKSTSKLSSFERNTSIAGRSMMKAGGIMMGAGAAVGAATLGIAKSTAAYGDEMWKTSQAVGVGVEEYQKLAYAARYSNVESAELAAGMAKLNKKLVEAAGGSKTAGQVFTDLGVKLKNSEGKLRAPNEILADFAQIFHDLEDGPEKTALAMEVFGKSGANLIPLLNSGRAGLEEMGAEAVRTGHVMSKEAALAAEKFNDDLARVTDGAKGLMMQLGTTLIPVLNELVVKITAAIGRVTDWIKENPQLADTIGKVAVGLAALLVIVGSASLLFGGLTFIVGKFGILFRGVSTAIKLGTAVIAACRNGMLLFRIQYIALVVWQKLAAVAQWLFNTALYACPVVWIIAAIMAVIAVVVLMVKYWDKIVAFFKQIWEGIKNVFKNSWEGIKNIWSAVTGWFGKLWNGIKETASKVWGGIKNVISKTKEGVQKAWGATKGFFGRLWGGIKEGVSKGWNSIKTGFLNYTPHGLIIKHWDSITGWFSNIWGKIKGGISGAWDGIKNWFSNLNPVEWIRGAWDSVGEFFGNLGKKFWDWGKNIINSLWTGITSMVDKVVEGVKNIGKKIASGFKSIFGINSPSKLFMEYGVNITQGLAMGLGEGTPEVEHATESLAMQATRGAERSMTSNMVDASQVANSYGGASVNYSPNITIQGSMDQSTQQDFAKLLRQHRDEIVDIIRRDSQNKLRLSYQ